MKPLICPQCGGKITQYSLWETFATCGYCGTRFLIEREQNKLESQTQPVYQQTQTSSSNPSIFIGILIAVFFGFGAIVLLGIFISVPKPEPKIVYPVYPTPYRTPAPRFSPTPTPNPNLLEFGGKGTGNGMFKDADSIAVDKQGRIYVADETLRVQQFDEKGQFLKLWQIPSETQFYKRARTIQKIAVDDQDRLHVLVGGVVFVYENSSTEPLKAVYFSPDAILDFAIRSDGWRLYVVTDDNIETLYYINDKGKTVKKIAGFHTETADASLSPSLTALAAIRLAVDGAGNIYSIYAFGDLGSYQLSYNQDELLIFRFTPEGKYVNKFVETMNSCGIEVDNQSRIYISDQNSIKSYAGNGQLVSSISGLKGVNAFALDKQNYVYILHDDTVIKRAAIQ
jgi:muconolactone delta-isomerase